MTYPSDHKNEGQIIDADVKDIPKEDKEMKDKKVSFFEKHPVATRRLKTVGKVLAGIGTVVGAVIVGNAVSDHNRTYYQIDLDPRQDGSKHIEDLNPDLVDPIDSPIIAEKADE